MKLIFPSHYSLKSGIYLTITLQMVFSLYILHIIYDIYFIYISIMNSSIYTKTTFI